MHITLSVVIIPSGVLENWQKCLQEKTRQLDTGRWQEYILLIRFLCILMDFQTVLLMNSLKRQEFQEYFAISRLQEHR